MKATRFLTLPVILAIVLQGCGGGNFAATLMNILDASAPFVDALPLPPNIRAGLLVDFQDLARGASVLKTNLDACAKVKSCQLTAVDSYAALFETVYARGHMGADNEKLRRTITILRALIASAKLYYGGAFSGPVGGAATGGTKEDLERQLKDLRKAMS